MKEILKEDKKYLAELFYDTFHLKMTTQQFSSQIAQAGKLLKLYSKEDIEKVIKYLEIHPPKNVMYSIAYLSYVMNQYLPLANHYFMDKQVFKVEDSSEVKKVENKKKIKKSSLFKNNKGF